MSESDTVNFSAGGASATASRREAASATALHQSMLSEHAPTASLTLEEVQQQLAQLKIRPGPIAPEKGGIPADRSM